MPKEYIERGEVLKHKRKMNGADFSGEFWDEAVLCEDIWKIPKADVTEVKHGRWIKGVDETFGCEYVSCSKCGEELYPAENTFTFDTFYNFCPYCGAKMDKERAKMIRTNEDHDT